MHTVDHAPTSAQSFTEAQAIAALAASFPTCRALVAGRTDLREIAGRVDLTGLAPVSIERTMVGRCWVLPWTRDEHAFGNVEVAGLVIQFSERAWEDAAELVVEGARVGVVDEFETRWGAPVTHERALRIATDELASLTLAERNAIETAMNDAVDARGCR